MNLKKIWNLFESKRIITMIYMFLASFMIGMSALGVSSLSSYVVNAILKGYVNDYLYKIIYMIIVVFISLILFFVFKHFCVKNTIEMKSHLNERVFESMLSKSIDSIHQYNNGQIVTNILDDTKKTTKFLEDDLPALFETLIVSFMMGVVTLFVNKIIFIVVLLLSCLSAFSTFMSRKMSIMENESLQLKDSINTKVSHFFNAIPILSSIQGTKHLMKKMDGLIDELNGIEVKKKKLFVLYSVLAQVCSIMREIIIIIFGLGCAGLDIGMIVAMLNITSFFNEIVKVSGEIIIKFSKVSVSVSRLYDIFEGDKEEEKDFLQVRKEINALEICHLSYMYNRSNGLKDFSAKFVKGKVNVIIGNVGSGKSTLGKLICGLMLQQSGKILIDGKEALFEELRWKTAYVDQEAVINIGTIAENVNCFSENRNVDKEKYAIERVGLKSWVDSLERGSDTTLNFENVNLSGGQKQRLAIARALYKDSEILVLDEPTSSLDRDNSEKIMSLLNELKDRKVIIMVTHDERILKEKEEYLNIIEMGRG